MNIYNKVKRPYNYGKKLNRLEDSGLTEDNNDHTVNYYGDQEGL